MTTAGAAESQVSGPLASGEVEVRATPFEYFVAERVFDDALAEELLAALEQKGDWLLHSGDFFEQYEWNLAAERSASVATLLSDATVDRLRRRVERYLSCALEPRVKVIAHRLVAGQGIGLHNDAPRDGDETHRLVVHLGREYDDQLGGHLVFFDGAATSEIHRIFRPLHNTGVGFAMSEDSFHAVSTVRSGERYTLVFSFWSRLRSAAARGEQRAITLDRGLAAGQSEAAHLLYESFPAKAPLPADEDGDRWRFTLAESVTPGIRLDPALGSALAGFLGIGGADRSRYRFLRRLPDGRLFLRSLEHSWALWAWSLWHAAERDGEPVLIVHIDSHADLGAPPLICTEQRGVFRLPLSDAKLDVADPVSVAAAIGEGRIGIGSFIAPFLHSLARCDMHHVAGDEVAEHGAGALTLHGAPLPAPLRGERPAVEVALQALRQPIVGMYRRSDLETLATLEPEGPVLLDIDMDYFCNRFDTSEPARLGAAQTLAGVQSGIGRLGRLLSCNPALTSRVEVVTLALSPGFFPSEFWAESVPRIEEAIVDALETAPPEPARRLDV